MIDRKPPWGITAFMGLKIVYMISLTRSICKAGPHRERPTNTLDTLMWDSKLFQKAAHTFQGMSQTFQKLKKRTCSGNFGRVQKFNAVGPWFTY